jgi:ligand-binding SRPBCC domain-containing protein
LSQVRLHFSCELAAPQEEVWRHASSMAGVNYELGPWVRMSHPARFASIADALGSGAVLVPGRTMFHSWITLAWLILLDRHAFGFERLLPGEGFDERSHSWTQRRWLHRRRVLAVPGGSCVTDQLEFEPRLGLMTPLLKPIIAWLFRHRHRQLRRRFGSLT